MQRLKIGIITDSLKLPLLESIEKASEIGAEGVQLYAVSGVMAPENITGNQRKKLKSFCNGEGLKITALCGDLGGHGFQIDSENPHKIVQSRKIAELAVDLGTSVVTTHIGVVPEDRSNKTYSVMASACKELGRFAQDLGVVFAIETGPEPANRLKQFLIDVDSDGIKVNFDPANFVMVLGEDPVESVNVLRDYIVHTHAKDGVRYKPCDPVEIYRAFAEQGVEGFNFGLYFNEVPLGEGQVNWKAYLSALHDIGYTGYLTIEREVGENPEADIRQAVRFLRTILKE